ncbi:hypothetical protein Vi05172_g433 [Venturia inaequalis]|nr:hypothetical protein Vi05172_g433 [Venturia inaequalis]
MKLAQGITTTLALLQPRDRSDGDTIVQMRSLNPTPAGPLELMEVAFYKADSLGQMGTKLQLFVDQCYNGNDIHFDNLGGMYAYPGSRTVYWYVRFFLLAPIP